MGSLIRDVSPSQGLLQSAIFSIRSAIRSVQYPISTVSDQYPISTVSDQYISAVFSIADWRSPWEGETSLIKLPIFPSLSDVLKQVFFLFRTSNLFSCVKESFKLATPFFGKYLLSLFSPSLLFFFLFYSSVPKLPHRETQIFAYFMIQ